MNNIRTGRTLRIVFGIAVLIMITLIQGALADDSVRFIADRNTYMQYTACGPSEHPVKFTLINDGTDTIYLGNPRPWEVEKVKTGEKVAPGGRVIQVTVSLGPGTSRSWTWDQEDFEEKQVPEGIYRGVISYSIGTRKNKAYTQEFNILPDYICQKETPIIAKATPFAYITNAGSKTVSVIDTATNTITANVSVGSNPNGVAVSPDGKKVYVANSDWDKLSAIDTVSIIDTATNTVTATVNVGLGPNGVAVSPDGTKAYVTNDGSNTVSVIDTATNNVTANVPVGTNPRGVAVSPDGTKVYVANSDWWNNISAVDTVFAIDTATNTVTANVSVGNNPWGVAVSPDGKKVYVANYGSNTTSVIDTATNTVTANVPVGWGPVGVAVSPDGTKVYVVNYHTPQKVSVIDAATNNVIADVRVGRFSHGVAVSPDGTKLYVTNDGSDTVSVIDTSTNTVTDTVKTGSRPMSWGQFICPLQH